MSNYQDKFLLFSIVIANFNNGDTIESAIESILNQDYLDFELIIVDGGSSDKSIDIIKQYSDKIAWWCSEPDRGQSNAFNKGFAQAKGEFITWLNADDILLPGTLSAVKKALETHPYADYATGNFVRFISDTGEISEASWGPHYLPKWLQGKGRYNPIFGPTTFWRKSVYDKLGPIDESLNYTMDVEYWSRLKMSGYYQVRVNHYCWGFRMHERSKTAEFGDHERDKKVKRIMANEAEYIRKKNRDYPTKFWRNMGYVMRCLDGSAVIMFLNKWHIVRKDFKSYFKIKYKV